MADYLPQDVLVSIFTRLAIKTLLQCTSVCKSWHSLIVNPSFINSYINRPPTQANNNANHLMLVRTCSSDDEDGKELFINSYINRPPTQANNNANHLMLVRTCSSDDEDGKELYSLHCDDEAFDEYVKLHFPFSKAFNMFFWIVGSCNGVLCLTDDQMSYVHNTILWNPSIQKWVTLPRPRVTYTSHGGFDHAIGFDIDAKSSDYMVVRFVRFIDFDSEVCPEIDLYSLSTGVWRNISHLGLPYVIRGRATQAYLNGAAHWIGADMERRCSMFVSFHKGDELFHSMSLPAGIPFLPRGPSPAVILGSLSMVEEKGYGQERSWCIWVMKDYGVASSWTKLLDVGIGERVHRQIGFRREGELRIEARGDLISFRPRDVQVKGLGIRNNTGDWYKESLHTEAYVESLVLVGSPEQTKEMKLPVKKKRRLKLGVEKKKRKYRGSRNQGCGRTTQLK